MRAQSAEKRALDELKASEGNARKRIHEEEKSRGYKGLIAGVHSGEVFGLHFSCS